MSETIENKQEEILLSEESDNEIELKPKKEKVKKVLSDKQKESLEKGRIRRKENLNKKKEEEEKIKNLTKKEVEDKVVKKAVVLKKKQILQSIINDTPDDEEIEEKYEKFKNTKTPVKRMTTYEADEIKSKKTPPPPPPQPPRREIIFL